jgi:hypothetical protein
VAGLDIEPIPAGLLIRSEGAPPTPPLDRAYGLATHAEHPRLLLGRLGEPGCTAAQVATLISLFPPMLNAVLELVPHTPGVATARWFTEVASRLGRDVRAASGLPLYGHDGRIHVIAHDAAGGQLLRHPATTLRYSADGTVRVVACQAPPTGWVGAGDAVCRLPGTAEPGALVAEVVPAGFALIPATAAGRSHAGAALPAEPHRLTVAVGLPATPLPRRASHTVQALLAGLGPDARARLRVLVLGEATPDQKQLLFGAADLVEFADATTHESTRQHRPGARARVLR